MSDFSGFIFAFVVVFLVLMLFAAFVNAARGQRQPSQRGRSEGYSESPFPMEHNGSAYVPPPEFPEQHHHHHHHEPGFSPTPEPHHYSPPPDPPPMHHHG